MTRLDRRARNPQVARIKDMQQLGACARRARGCDLRRTVVHTSSGPAPGTAVANLSSSCLPANPRLHTWSSDGS